MLIEQREFVASGSVNVMDVRQWTAPRHENQNTINFGGVTFPTPPKVFYGFNFLDLKCDANLRLKATVDNVTTTGLTWHIDSWYDSTLYAAGISYIAFQPPSSGTVDPPPPPP